MSGPIVRFMIKRQASPQSSPYWEEFDLHSRPGMNAIVGLMDIAANPVDRLGNPTTRSLTNPTASKRSADRAQC
jgi:succinate dehydrogenase / fumarate reductase, iron-sulfur subunit